MRVEAQGMVKGQKGVLEADGAGESPGQGLEPGESRRGGHSCWEEGLEQSTFSFVVPGLSIGLMYRPAEV